MSRTGEKSPSAIKGSEKKTVAVEQSKLSKIDLVFEDHPGIAEEMANYTTEQRINKLRRRGYDV